MSFGLNLELEKRRDIFPSKKLAKLLDYLNVMEIYFFMFLTVTTPHLHFVEKKSFFETRQNCPEITSTFAKLSSINCPSQISESDFQALEQFVVSLYNSIVLSTHAKLMLLEELCLLKEEEP